MTKVDAVSEVAKPAAVKKSAKKTSIKAAADKKLIAAVSVFDLFEGPSLGEDKKSVAVEVDIQPTDRTLTDADIEALAEQIIENVSKKTGGVLRG